MLKTVYSGARFSHEDVLHYARGYSIIDALARAGGSFDEEIERLLGVDNYSMEDDLGEIAMLRKELNGKEQVNEYLREVK